MCESALLLSCLLKFCLSCMTILSYLFCSRTCFMSALFGLGTCLLSLPFHLYLCGILLFCSCSYFSFLDLATLSSLYRSEDFMLPSFFMISSRNSFDTFELFVFGFVLNDFISSSILLCTSSN